MSPQEKSAVNAENAQHSTGPVTLEGKAASSMNAVKHGLSAQQPVVSPDQQEEFHELQQALLDEIAPDGALETTVFNHLLHAAWKLQRVTTMEQEILDRGLDALEDEKTAKTLDRLNRYEAAADRAWYRALKEMRTLQTARALRHTVDPEIAELIPTQADIPAISRQQARSRTGADHYDPIDEILNAPVPHIDFDELRAKYLPKEEAEDIA